MSDIYDEDISEVIRERVSEYIELLIDDAWIAEILDIVNAPFNEKNVIKVKSFINELLQSLE